MLRWRHNTIIDCENFMVFGIGTKVKPADKLEMVTDND